MSTKLTITESLAEIKTIQKRIEKKREFVGTYLFRQDKLKDPLVKGGGSSAVIKQERQAIGDLENRAVLLRRAIQNANETTEITINGVARSIADWLVWRRDIAPGQRGFLATLTTGISRVRSDAQQKGLSVVAATESASTPDDVVVNLDETELAEEIEHLEETLGMLDGQLSLKNATVFVTV